MTLFEMHALAQEITNDFEKNYVFAIMKNDESTHGHIFFDSTNRFYIEDEQNIAMLGINNIDWKVQAIGLLPIKDILYYHNFVGCSFDDMIDWIRNTPGVIPYEMEEEEKEKSNDIDTVITQLKTFPYWESDILERIEYTNVCQHIANAYDNDDIIDMIIFLLERVKDRI